MFFVGGSICAMVKVVAFYWGWELIPPFNRESLFHGYINHYGIGLMSLSPIIWKFHGS